MIGDPESAQVQDLLRLVDRELARLRYQLECENPPPAIRRSLEVRQELLLRMATAVVEETPAHSPLLAQLISLAMTLPDRDLELLLDAAQEIA